MSLLNTAKLAALAALAFSLLVIGLWVDGHIVAVAATMPSEEMSALVRTVFRMAAYTIMMVPTFGIIMGVICVIHDHRFETREELDSSMANTVHKVTEYGPRVAGLTIDSVVDATFIINRHTLRCISDVFVCKDGYTWLVLRDELVLSVVYEDGDICHCVCPPDFEWLALDYIDEGLIPMSMVEVANA